MFGTVNFGLGSMPPQLMNLFMQKTCLEPLCAKLYLGELEKECLPATQASKVDPIGSD